MKLAAIIFILNSVYMALCRDVLRYFNDKLTWQSASKRCGSLNGSLVTIDDEVGRQIHNCGFWQDAFGEYPSTFWTGGFLMLSEWIEINECYNQSHLSYNRSIPVQDITQYSCQLYCNETKYFAVKEFLQAGQATECLCLNKEPDLKGQAIPGVNAPYRLYRKLNKEEYVEYKECQSNDCHCLRASASDPEPLLYAEPCDKELLAECANGNKCSCLNWTTAELFCNVMSTTLKPVPKHLEATDWVGWIGVRRKLAFIWSEYASKHKPDNCTMLNREKMLFLGSCDDERPFVCQIDSKNMMTDDCSINSNKIIRAGSTMSSLIKYAVNVFTHSQQQFNTSCETDNCSYFNKRDDQNNQWAIDNDTICPAVCRTDSSTHGTTSTFMPPVNITKAKKTTHTSTTNGKTTESSSLMDTTSLRNNVTSVIGDPPQLHKKNINVHIIAGCVGSSVIVVTSLIIIIFLVRKRNQKKKAGKCRPNMKNYANDLSCGLQLPEVDSKHQPKFISLSNDNDDNIVHSSAVDVYDQVYERSHENPVNTSNIKKSKNDILSTHENSNEFAKLTLETGEFYKETHSVYSKVDKQKSGSEYDTMHVSDNYKQEKDSSCMYGRMPDVYDHMVHIKIKPVDHSQENYAVLHTPSSSDENYECADHLGVTKTRNSQYDHFQVPHL